MLLSSCVQTLGDHTNNVHRETLSLANVKSKNIVGTAQKHNARASEMVENMRKNEDIAEFHFATPETGTFPICLNVNALHIVQLEDKRQRQQQNTTYYGQKLSVQKESHTKSAMVDEIRVVSLLYIQL